MDYNQLCMYCFKEIGAESVCPHCGGDQMASAPENNIPPGSVLADRYIIGYMRGQDSDGIVYNAFDSTKNVRRRIREYFPESAANRLPDGSVEPKPEKKSEFRIGMERMRKNAENNTDESKHYTLLDTNGTLYVIERKVHAAPESETPRVRFSLILAILCVVVILGVIAIIYAVKSCNVKDNRDPDTDILSTSATYNPLGDATVEPTPYATSGEPGAITSYVPVWQNQTGGESMPDAQHYATPTPTATPRVTPTPNLWGNIVNDTTYDPWGEYDYWNPVSTPTPRPTASPTRAANLTITARSSKEDITNLQWQLIELGWLNANVPTGVFDNATKEAVKAFQAYINQTQNAKLTVDGICGAKTFVWLDQYLIAINPNIHATPAPTSGDITSTSPALRIRELQLKLIASGWLTGSATGVYDSVTAAAVVAFQNYVNASAGVNLLSVTGIADINTQIMLSYGTYVKPTATPGFGGDATPAPTHTPAPTQPGATVDPDDQTDLLTLLSSPVTVVVTADSAPIFAKASPNATTLGSVVKNAQYTKLAENETWVMLMDNNGAVGYTYQAAVTEAWGGGGETEKTSGIGPESSAEEIASLQNQLIALYYLPAGSATGTYDGATTQAVYDFQTYVNALIGSEVMRPSGFADENTLDYLLDDTYAKPTSAPTQDATIAPTTQPMTELGTPESVKVITDGLPVYADTNEALTPLGNMPINANMLMLARNEVWARVQNANGNIGYCLLSGLAAVAPSAEPTLEPTATPTPVPTVDYTIRPLITLATPVTVTVSYESLTVYNATSEDSQALGSMPQGMTMLLLAEDGQWAKVQNNRGDIGYCLYAGLLLPVEPTIEPTVEATSAPTPMPLYPLDSPINVTVKDESLTVYESTFLDSRALGNMPQGTSMLLIAEDGQWAKVQNGQGDIGYCLYAGLLLPVEQPTDEPTQTPEATTPPQPESTPIILTPYDAPLSVTVAVNDLVVYDAAGDSGRALGTMVMGQQMLLLAENGQWAQVQNARGDVGYCLRSGLTETPAATEPPEIVVTPEPTATMNPLASVPNQYNVPVTVTAVSLPVYSLPDNTSLLMGVMSQGSRMNRLADDGIWCRVTNELGDIGYTLMEYLADAPAETPTPTAEPTPEITPEPTAIPYAPGWMNSYDAVMAVQLKLIDGKWLSIEDPRPGTMDEVTYTAIAAFVDYYNANYANGSDRPYLASLRNADGTLTTDGNGWYVELDEFTYTAILDAMLENPNF